MHTGSSVPLNATKNWKFQLWVKWILFGFQTSTEYEYEYYSGLGNDANTNTNSIRFLKIIRIRIRIVFGLKISAEYEYEYHYSVSTIRILFEYRIIRSPLILHCDGLLVLCIQMRTFLQKIFTQYIPSLIQDFTVFGLNKIPEANHVKMFVPF